MRTYEAGADVARHLANHPGVHVKFPSKVRTVLHKGHGANVTDPPGARPGPPGRGIVEGDVGWDGGDLSNLWY
jgi:hypothetical protein